MRILSFPITVSLSLPLPAFREERSGGKLAAALVMWGRVSDPSSRVKDPAPHLLRNNLRDRAGAYRMPTFANREPQALFHRHRSDQLDHQAHVVSRHHHLRARRQLRHARHVRRSQIKLWTISLKERRMTSAFFLRQDIDLSLELGVRRDRSTLCQHHPALDVFLRNAAQQQASVVARHAFVQLLLEHFDAGHNRLAGLAESDNLRFLADLHLATLDTTGDHCTATL